MPVTDKKVPPLSSFAFLFFLVLISGSLVSCHSRIMGSTKDDTAKAQHRGDTANYPYWIAMMDDPNVNYFKAVDAFNKFWEHREQPTEDDGEARDIFNKSKTEEEKEKEKNRTSEYVYEYKRFLNWQQRNKNLVKPDSTIMSGDEIIEQWKRNQTDTIQR